MHQCVVIQLLVVIMSFAQLVPFHRDDDEIVFSLYFTLIALESSVYNTSGSDGKICDSKRARVVVIREEVVTDVMQSPH